MCQRWSSGYGILLFLDLHVWRRAVWSSELPTAKPTIRYICRGSRALRGNIWSLIKWYLAQYLAASMRRFKRPFEECREPVACFSSEISLAIARRSRRYRFADAIINRIRVTSRRNLESAQRESSPCSAFVRLRIPQIACKSGLTDDATNGNGIRRPSLVRAVSPATKARKQSETWRVLSNNEILLLVNKVLKFFSHNLRARITRITRNIPTAR